MVELQNTSDGPSTLDDMPVEPVPTEVVATVEEGDFIEGIVAHPDGHLYATGLVSGRVYRIGLDGSVAVIRQFPIAEPMDFGAGPTGGGADHIVTLCLGLDGELFVAVAVTDPAVRGLWRLDPDGSGERLAPLPADADPNGTTVDRAGNLYAADTGGGLIWRVPAGGSDAEVWCTDPLVTAVTAPWGGRMGPNGLQHVDGALLVTMSMRNTVVRVPIEADGSPGPAEVVATGMGGDDFAVLPDGTLYVTTHPSNWVVRIPPDGGPATRVAGVDQGVVGSACAVYHPGTGDVFVGTDGGLFGFEDDRPRTPPSVVRLRL